MLSIAVGHDVNYVLKAVAGGRESYYSGAVAAGEPPGLWFGAGSELLGLRGEVDADQMRAIFADLKDPRDPSGETLLGRPHKKFRTAEELYEAALEREPDADAERCEDLRAQAEVAERQPVGFLDITFSAPKSVSVLAVAFERAANEARAAGNLEEAAAWEAHHEALEDAVLAGARAAIAFLQDKAGYARVGHHGGGAGRWIDAHEWVSTLFLQHDSRDGDPQLHVHGPTLNRVRCADGVWRALDSKAIYAWKPAAGAVAERLMEAYAMRTVGLLFATRPDGKAREIVGIDQLVRDLYSSRRHATTKKAAELLDTYAERIGRDPSALERWKLHQQAMLITRKAKSHHGETHAEQLDRWAREIREEMVTTLTDLAHQAVARGQQAGPADTWSERDVIERAQTLLEDRQGNWGYAQAMKAVSDALPGHLDLDPDEVLPLLEGLTAELIERVARLGEDEDTGDLPPGYVLDNGASSYQGPASARYATFNQIAGVHALRRAAVARGAATIASEHADAVLTGYAAHGVDLGDDQAAAVRGVCSSGAWLEVLSAAAGTGKTVTTGAVARAWQTGGHRVFGLAPSQVAAQVLGDEAITATNTTRWLATQDRLAATDEGEARRGPAAVATETPAPEASTTPGASAADADRAPAVSSGAADDAPDAGGGVQNRTPHGGDEAWRLAAGDLLIVDEAGMVDSGQLAAIQARCAQAGAKLLLVGDPRQLGAVGSGGALGDLAERAIGYQLAEVRRFSNAWEGPASLRLRDGDPGVLGEYQRHGRLVGAGTPDEAERAATRAWLADTLAGRQSVLLVPSNQQATRVNTALRAQLIELGRVQEAGVELGRDRTVAGVGDLVQARRNGWELVGAHGNTRAPINRETYRVSAVHDDGALTVTPVHGRADQDGDGRAGERLVLPASYVAADVTLAYASTVHAAQGRTVDTGHAVLDGADAPAAYVALTRGRDTNTAYVVTRPLDADAPTGQANQTPARAARAVLADALARARTDRSAVAVQEEAAAAAASTQTHADRLIAVAAEASAGRTAAELDRLTAHGLLSVTDRRALAADDGIGAVEQLLRTAEIGGLDRHRMLQQAVAQRDFTGARSPAQVLYARLDDALAGHRAPVVTSYTDLIPAQVPDSHREFLTNRAEAADTRRRELGAQLAEQAPQWAREALGPVPDEPLARADWEQRAGWAASYRELAGHTDDVDPLGPAPAGALVDKQALWRTAHQALRLPEAGGDEHECTDGQLRVRVAAYEREKTWAPRYVGDELGATTRAAERHRADAQVWVARASAATDPGDRDQHQRHADAARAEAEGLAERAQLLEDADHARALWYVHTAVTRETAARARGVLQARGIDLDDPDERTTAAEWLDAHRADQAAEDADREITDESQLLDHAVPDDLDYAARRDEDVVEVPEPRRAPDTVAVPPLETVVDDIRDTTDAAAPNAATGRGRIPSTDETAAAVACAQAALAELDARRRAEAAREAEAEHRDELTRWAEHDNHSMEVGDALER